jgi:sulfide:quinone oxidoreductase
MPRLDKPSSGTGGEFRVVIVGGGVAAIEAALCLDALAGDRVSVTLLAPNQDFVYVPMATQEPFGRAAARRYRLARVAEDAGAVLCADTLAWLDSDFSVVHTARGEQLAFDALLLAPGATVYANFRDAVTLDPHRLADQLHGVLEDIDTGRVRHLAFVIPDGPVWPLPIYELALMTAQHAREHSAAVQITIVTSEPTPLAVFGATVAEHLVELLASSSITTVLSTQSAVRGPGQILLLPHPGVRADRIQPGDEIRPDCIIALPQLFGPHCPGVPTSSRRGFLSTDRFGKVRGLDRTFAAGDATDFPIKFGGLAAQQADVAAQSIAKLAGANVEPDSVRPRLQAVLLTGGRPLLLSAQPKGSAATASAVEEMDPDAPRPKIAARYLAPYLQQLDRAAAAVGTGS